MLWASAGQIVSRGTKGPLREILPGDSDRYRARLASGAVVETCIACWYSHQNMDKTLAMLRFENIFTVLPTTGLHYYFWV